jgi:hypothetical protein
MSQIGTWVAPELRGSASANLAVAWEAAFKLKLP